MPIRFRCVYCDKLLGIARRKAGAIVGCPHCGEKLVVPTPEEPDAPVPAGAMHDEPSIPDDDHEDHAPPAPPAPPPRPREQPAPVSSGKGIPLFERSDFEELLNPEPTYRNDPAPPPLPAPKQQPQAQPPKPQGQAPRPAPAPRPIQTEPPHSLEPLSLDDAPSRPRDGIYISRTRMTWISVLGVLLIAAVFGVGIAVGKILR